MPGKYGAAPVSVISAVSAPYGRQCVRKTLEADVTEHYKIIAPPLTPPNNPSKKPMPRSDDRRALGLTGAKPEHWAAKRRANTVFMVSWC